MGRQLTKEDVQKTTDRLAGLYSCSYSHNELDIWWMELKDKSVGKEMLSEAIELLRKGEKGSWKPNLNTFLYYLNEAQITIREKIWALQKREESKFKNMGYDEILAKGENNKSTKVQKWIALTKQRLKGEIDLDTFNKRHQLIKEGKE